MEIDPALVGKCLVLIGLFFCTAVVALAPVYYRSLARFIPCLNRFSTFMGNSSLELVNAFAAGVFLVTGVVGVLGEALESSDSSDLVLVVFVLGFLLTLTFETVFSGRSSAASGSNSAILSMVLASALSFHSLLEGAAIGLEDSVASAAGLTLAIIPHKFTEAFAIGSFFRRASLVESLQSSAALAMILMFCAASPLGGFVSAVAKSIIAPSTGTVSLFLALAAGTFLHVAIVDLMIPALAGNRLGSGHSHSHGFVELDPEAEIVDSSSSPLTRPQDRGASYLRPLIAVLSGAVFALAFSGLAHVGGHSHAHLPTVN